MPWLRSTFSAMASSETGWKKEGQPVPESYFASERKSGLPQQTQW